jgi:hypothetical protein
MFGGPVWIYTGGIDSFFRTTDPADVTNGGPDGTLHLSCEPAKLAFSWMVVKGVTGGDDISLDTRLVVSLIDPVL